MAVAESETKSLKQAIAEGINLLAQGKRNLLCGEIHQAVNQLEEAAKIFSKEYGEMAHECADVYFLYGQALLELHRCESNVFEDCQQSESSDEDDDEDEKEEEKISDAESDRSEDIANEDPKVDDPQPTSTIRTEEYKKDDTNDGNNAETNHSEKNGSDQNEDEDVSNLQLSWETLELAKLIYLRQEESDIRLKLADTHSKLGDVGLEMEQFEEAIKDYNKCLQIQESILSKDSRRIAETLYQLGVAHNLQKSYDASCNYFRASINAMDMRQKRLEKVATGEIPPDASEDGDGFYTPVELAAKEVEELSQLIKEVYSKIEEVEDEKNNAPNVCKLLKESIASTHDGQATNSDNVESVSGLGSIVPSTQNTSASTSVHVITHLVRKKRTNPEGPEESDEKRQKTNDTKANPPNNSI